MTILLISDLHLDGARPRITALFERFLREQARQATALYILGDLFEAWVGDDDDSELPARVAAALADLRANGVPVYFLAGNRDFLLGAGYARRAGLILLEDGVVHTLAGTPTLLLHGDTLCSDDEAYQAFRRQVRDPAWQRDFLARPLAERRDFAAQARVASRDHQQGTREALMDVNADAVAHALRAAGVSRMIHGHTHRPAIHDLMLDGTPAQRIVLGDWYEQGSLLRVTRDQAMLQDLELS
jgi:UDP-2,3-diacylglucosamine hydrolase